MENKEAGLKRVFGVFGLSTNIINIIVGAGIFVLPAIVAAGLGPSSIFAYLFCGLLISLVMLCFAEAGSKVTTSGGAYIYIKTAFGTYFGFLSSVLFILASMAADAAVANAIVDIAGSIFPLFKLQVVRTLSLLLLFSIFALINIKGASNGIRMVQVFTIIKLIPLLLSVFFSWGAVSVDNLAIVSLPSFNKIGEISLILFFAFQGAESSLSISGEVKNPEKNIPRGIFLAILVVLVLYILLQTASIGVLGDTLATFQSNPLGAVANQVFGPVGFTLMTIGAAISMVGYLSSAILSMPRILFQASKDNVLPIPALKKIHKIFQTPYISIITYAGAGFLLAAIGAFEQLAIISSATVLLIYLGVSLAVMKLKKEINSEKKTFKIPGGKLVPILSSMTIIYLLSNLAKNEFIVIISAIAILTLVYYILKRSAVRTTEK